MTSRRNDCSVVSGLILLLASISACDDEPGGADVSSDATADALDMEDAPQDASADLDVTVDRPDEEPDQQRDDIAEDAVDALIELGEIRGRIFNNTGVTDGILRIGLLSEQPIEGQPFPTPISLIEEESAAAPAQSYEFVEVPIGDYWVYATLDVGDPNELGDPGPGDLVGSTPDMIRLHWNDHVVDNVNVEVR